jgi:hypothetical protein
MPTATVGGHVGLLTDTESASFSSRQGTLTKYAPVSELPSVVPPALEEAPTAIGTWLNSA